MRDSERSGTAGTAKSAAPTNSLKDIEAGLHEGQGLVLAGGNPVIVTRNARTTGPTVSHTGALPAALEQDLAKVQRETAADRIGKQVETNALLVGETIEGIRFEKQGFCNTDLIGDYKKKDTVIGTKEGTYKKTFSGKIQVTFKEYCYTHPNWTDGKASKREKIKPLEKVQIDMPYS